MAQSCRRRLRLCPPTAGPRDFLFGKNWHAVDAAELGEEHAMAFPADCEAVMIEGDCESVRSVAAFLDRVYDAVAADPHFSVPLFIVVLSAARASACIEEGPRSSGSSAPAAGQQAIAADDIDRSEVRGLLRAAQALLHEHGVEEVIPRVPDPFDMHVSIQMAVDRAAHARALRIDWEAGIMEQQQHHQKCAVKQAVKDAMETVRGQLAQSIWLHAHELSQMNVPRVNQRLPNEVTPGAVFGDLVVEQKLGQGGFGAAFAARRCDTGELEAIKVFRKLENSTPSAVINVCREAEFLRRFDHENIVALHGVMNAPQTVIFRMEFAGVQNLHRVMVGCPGRRLPLARAQDLFGQMAAAVEHCHSRGVAHCDLKPENVVVSACGERPGGERLKLIDFGCAVSTDSRMRALRGTMPFVPPEAMTADLAVGYDPAAADIWAVGVVLLEMVLGVGSLSKIMGWSSKIHPSAQCGDELLSLFSNRPDKIHKAIKKVVGDTPPNFAALLDGMLCVSPACRLSAAEVTQHSWWLYHTSERTVEAQPSCEPLAAEASADAPAAGDHGSERRPEAAGLPRRPSGHRPRTAPRPGPRPMPRESGGGRP